MTVVAIVPAAVCILGLLLWALGPSKVKQPAIWMFAAGLLVWLFTVADKVWKV